MPIRVLLRDQPHRAIALATTSHVLIFRHSLSSVEQNASASLPSASSRTGSNASTGPPRCMVEFSALEAADLEGYRSLSSLSSEGTLGLITLGGDVFLCVANRAAKVADVRPGEGVWRISDVDFYCLSSPAYDHVLREQINSYPTDDITEDAFDHGHGHGHKEPVLEHPCLAIKKLLSSGTFYFSTDFDLTNRLQNRSADFSRTELTSMNSAFLWNSHMIQPLLSFRSRLSNHEREALDASGILTNAIRGFVSTVIVPHSSSPVKTQSTGLPAALTLISRLSCRKAGTRFNARGIDDDGNVANFVETEMVFWDPSGICFSYVQTRGSVPVFWEQATGFLPGQQKIQITRSPEATQPAFDKHFEDLEQTYGTVHVVNLLSKDKVGELELTKLYRYHISRSTLNDHKEAGASAEHKLLNETDYDFNAETKDGGYQAASLIRRYIQESSDSFAYCLSEEVVDRVHLEGAPEEKALRRPVVVLLQEGVFRTNCLDCLDRTNLVQTIISQMALESFLDHRSERANADYWMRHGTLWADNGDALSRIYAGTGALKSSFTRHGKMNLAGALADARKSATRLYINNFEDKGRQNTIDLLLGRLLGQTSVDLYDPVNDYVAGELNRRTAEYSSSKTISIWAGTFNLNGRAEGLTEDLSSWLCPPVDPALQSPEIIAVGFQEIVELSPQQIMSTDPVRRQAWEEAVKKTLNANARKQGREEYLLVRGGQLVGASLSIFVKASVLPAIKNVEGSLKKTGMSGMAGNKGAVAIRMEYDNTTICFVTAHLAAGFANYEERNRDYKTISHGLHFQRNRRIDDHDTVIWLGDFNYRIGLSNERAREYIQLGDLEKLYENDQAGPLNLQMVAGLTFPYYSEARITFMPTYKYDVGTDHYDSSDKQRIPAWCDRVLRKGNNLRQIHYDTAPLRFSDHRPVYATFQCIVSIVDERLKDRIGQEIYQKRKAMVGSSTANGDAEDTDDEDLIGYESIGAGLPPASSDRRKWWLDNGTPARSKIEPPSDDFVANPNRPSNPFSPSTEPDWIRQTDSGLHSAQVLAAEDSRPAVSLRKLPPPLKSPSSIFPPPPKPRRGTAQTQNNAVRSSSTSSASTSAPIPGLARKPAPPVPRKPVVLRSPSNASSSSTGTGALNPSPTSTAPLGYTREETSTASSDEPAPPLPRRLKKDGSQQSSRAATATQRQTSNVVAKAPPNVLDGVSPVRRTPRQLPSRNLLDDNGDELSEWRPLVPR